MLDTIAFTYDCDEPEGIVTRTVRPIEFTPDNLIKLYNQISKFRTFMGKEIHNLDDMIRFFVSEENGVYKPRGLCMVVDDFVGLFWLSDIDGIFEASVHYTFFDRRHKGRIGLCKKAIEYTFNTFQFHRLTTNVPVTQPDTIKFVKKLGFVEIGTSRQNRIIRGRYYDTCNFDLLKEEFLNGISSGELQRTD